MRLVLLSHRVGRRTPLYPGTPPIQLTHYRSIERGDSSNLWVISMANHAGTHVDAPNHFYMEGRKISEYRLEELIFENVRLIDIPKEPGEEVSAEDLEPYSEIVMTSSLLLIRTGLQAYRDTDQEAYTSKGLLFSPSAAKFLKDSSPNLRALGIDAISVSTPLRRSEGRESHRILLSDNRFLIIEDMDLAGKPDAYRYVILAPLFLDEVDSAPCTVIGVTD
ncbi:Kynurenine formamidase [Candidatus Calditenuaceae archaeon HR02]|nr:Kynurenine formamidase [Candidatus Calditenuaceae archaeon HR02]